MQESKTGYGQKDDKDKATALRGMADAGVEVVAGVL